MARPHTNHKAGRGKRAQNHKQQQQQQQGGHRQQGVVFLHLRVQALIALARSFCLRLVYSLSACDAHDTAFGIIQGGAVGWLEDVSRTLLRVDLICRHDVSGGGNFSHQVSLRGGVLLWRGTRGGKSGKVHSLRPSIGTRPSFRSFLARRALLKQQSLHPYTLLEQPHPQQRPPHTRRSVVAGQRHGFRSVASSQ